jgi:hypothetical protein
MPQSATVVLLTAPPTLETLIVEGYGVAAAGGPPGLEARSLIVIGVGL